MKRISKRAALAMLLALTLILGLVVFAVIYIRDGAFWATYPVNEHIYSGGNINTGRVLDGWGNLLVETVNGQRVYNSDENVRKATLHIVGDKYGNIGTGVQSHYSEEMVGFDYLNGVYNLTGKGNDINLTLNAEVCAEAYAAFDGRKGTVGVYNYKTGEIICMVSSMSYDPENEPDIAGDTTGTYDGVYVNRFLSSDYVPGSIFKLVTSMAALENIDDIFHQKFYCGGSIDIGGDTINCSGVHGEIEFQRGLSVSCNVVFAQIAIQLGRDVLTEYAEKAGLNQSLEFDGLITSKGNFDIAGAADSSVGWSGIGQYTDTINSCGYMAFMGAIANGGEVVYPHVVSKITTPTGATAESFDTVYGERIMKPETAESLQIMMKNNVRNVYGENNYPGLDLCAKSGTAEVGGGKLPHATFSGFLRDPEYPLAFIVIVENGGDGSSISGSIANRVLQKAVEVIDER